MVNVTLKKPHTNSATAMTAKRLLGYEAAAPNASDPEMPPGFRVCEKLGDPLSRLIGSEGLRAILRRALTLGRRETEGLNDVKLTADGHVEGLNGHNEEVSVVLVAKVIGLIVTFLGEKLVLKLLQDVWPQEAETDRHPDERIEHGRQQ